MRNKYDDGKSRPLAAGAAEICSVSVMCTPQHSVSLLLLHAVISKSLTSRVKKEEAPPLTV